MNEISGSLGGGGDEAAEVLGSGLDSDLSFGDCCDDVAHQRSGVEFS
jgi:hypothetical protein